MESIESFLDVLRPHTPYILAGGAVLVSVVLIRKLTKKPSTPEYVKAPPGTAVIYQIGRGPRAPSLSPFPVKLETFCRLAGIPYLVDCTGRFSSRGKIPWMTFNGEVVEDSQMCIDFLAKTCNIDVNSHLSKEQRAVSKLIQVLVDEHLYWPAVLFRWKYYSETFIEETKKMGWPWYVVPMVKRNMSKQAYGQGIGRHTKEQVMEIMMEDLKCLSEYLGDKRYMLGDKICLADCSTFGLLSQFLYHHFDSEGLKGVIEDNFPNLHQYLLRVKEELWPDWNECCKEPEASH